MVPIDGTRCTGCGTCVEVCPSGALEIRDGFARLIADRCTGCGACIEACPQEAILLLPEAVGAADSREVAIAKPGSRPTDRSPEIITVRVPPPPTTGQAPQPLARQIVPALGATLAFLGREVAPRLLRLATGWMQEKARTPRGSSSARGAREQGTPGGGRPRWRRRRRGRR